MRVPMAKHVAAKMAPKTSNLRGDSIRPNENKMSDGGRDRASLEVEGWKSS